MLGWLFPSPAERRLLGGARLRGAAPGVNAIRGFNLVNVAAAGLDEHAQKGTRS